MLPVRLVLVAFLLLPAVSAASTWGQLEEPPEPTGVEKRLTKLGRGLANTAFGWAELPVTFVEKVREGRSLTYLLCVAPVLGVSRTVIRTGTGVVEMVTFPVSLGATDFGPLVEPEYVP
jgi:putative exosortase-associated protein (TIGR04073 family)